LGLILFNSAILADSDPLNSKQQALLKLLLPSLNKNKNTNIRQSEVDLDNVLNANVANNSTPLSLPYAANPAPSLSVNQNNGLISVISVGDLNPQMAHNSREKLKNPLVLIQSLLLIGNNSHSQLLMRLNEKPFYKIITDETHQVITLTLDDIDPRSLLSPMDMTNSVIQKIHYDYNDQRQLVITLILAPMVDVQGLRMMGDHPTEFVVDIGVGTLPPPAITLQNNNVKTNSGPYRPLVKTPSLYSSQDSEQTHEYNIALDLISQHELNKAKQILEKEVRKYPLFEEARVALAEIYLNQNQSQQALTVLTFMNITDASIADHVDYYTVLAESYRQSGNYNEAVKTYQALLNFGPDNAVWWTGLGLCLEEMGRKNDAQSAYLKAQSLGNLPPELNGLVRPQ
jgi:tetratricopeptide (TPR) repeat protein